MALGFGVFAISGWDFRLSSAAGLELRIHRGVKLRVQILCLKVWSRAWASELMLRDLGQNPNNLLTNAVLTSA